MEDTVPILAPAEYRRRAEICRHKATIYAATRDDFLMAADTWDALAAKAETLAKYEKQMET